MTTFEDRQKSFEKKFAHDSEMQFRAEARRNKLLGLWAAEKMGLSGDEADAYARSVVTADLKEKGDNDVFTKVAADFAEKGVSVADDELRKRMDDLLAQAKAQIVTEVQS